jgi:hypothetical protein
LIFSEVVYNVGETQTVGPGVVNEGVSQEAVNDGFDSLVDGREEEEFIPSLPVVDEDYEDKEQNSEDELPLRK